MDRNVRFLGVLVTVMVLLVASCSRDTPDSKAVPTPSVSVATSVDSATVVLDTVVPDTVLDDTIPTTVQPSAVTSGFIAAAIITAERGIRDTSSSPDEVAEFGRRQQRAYQLFARNPDLQRAVTVVIPPDVAVPFALNVAARQAVVDHAAGSPPSEPSSTLPAWAILEPRPIDELLADYHQAQDVTGVRWEYLAAINLVETRMGRVSGVSSAGALGPMQFLPQTWSACCIGDIEDPHDAIVGAATYLASLGAPDDMHAALFGYNPNEGYVGAVTAYAANLMADPLAYRGYHAWEVYVTTASGTVRLPVGYIAAAPIDAASYVRAHPQDLG